MVQHEQDQSHVVRPVQHALLAFVHGSYEPQAGEPVILIYLDHV